MSDLLRATRTPASGELQRAWSLARAWLLALLLLSAEGPARLSAQQPPEDPGTEVTVEVTPAKPQTGQPFRVLVRRIAPRGTKLPELDWPPKDALGGALWSEELPGGLTVMEAQTASTHPLRCIAFAAGELPFPDGTTLTIPSSLGEPPDLALELPAAPLPLQGSSSGALWLLLLPALLLGWIAFRRSNHAQPPAPLPTPDEPQEDLSQEREAIRARLRALVDTPLATPKEWIDAHDALTATLRDGAALGGVDLTHATAEDIRQGITLGESPQFATLEPRERDALAHLLHRCDVARFAPNPAGHGDDTAPAQWAERLQCAEMVLLRIWGTSR